MGLIRLCSVLVSSALEYAQPGHEMTALHNTRHLDIILSLSHFLSLSLFPSPSLSFSFSLPLSVSVFFSHIWKQTQNSSTKVQFQNYLGWPWIDSVVKTDRPLDVPASDSEAEITGCAARPTIIWIFMNLLLLMQHGLWICLEYNKVFNK